MSGFSPRAVKNALDMASAAIESKQKVIDMLQIEVEGYQKQLERYREMNLEAQAIAYGTVVETLPLEPHLQEHRDTPRQAFRKSHDKSIVVILQDTLDELNACKATIRQQEEKLELLDMLTKNGRRGKENRIADGTSCTSALYEKLLKEKDETISELALLLASREQSLRDAFAQAILASSLPSTPRSDV